jgi:hypothetical protein
MLGVALDDEIHKLSAADRLTLDYYLTNQIALEPAYTRQTQAIATLAATTASPLFGLYVNDWQQNGTDWGQQLADFLNQPAQLSSIVNMILTQAEGGMAQLSDSVTMLTVFDPTGGLATTYYDNVILALTATMALQADITQDSSLPDWLPDYINTFIQSYYTGKTRPLDPGPDQIAYDIAEDLFQGTQALGSAAQLAQEIIKQLQANQGEGLGEIAQRLQQALSGKVGKSIFSVLLVIGIVVSILALTNWDSGDLQPRQGPAGYPRRHGVGDSRVRRQAASRDGRRRGPGQARSDRKHAAAWRASTPHHFFRVACHEVQFGEQDPQLGRNASRELF